MPGHSDQPRPGWSALRVGPGGVPPEDVRPIGSAPGQGPRPRPEPGPGRTPAARRSSPDGPATAPLAVFGSFDDGRPRRRAIVAVTVLALVAAFVVGAALWSSDTPGSSSAVDLQPGGCLASSGGTTVIGVDCASPDAEFVIAARFDDTTDGDRCAVAASDVVLVTRGDAVLCLNYLARVGDCLYAGDTDAVGKAACRTSGSGATPRGLFRVIAVLTGTLSTRDCPPGTLETLVHRDVREVVCLGMP